MENNDLLTLEEQINARKQELAVKQESGLGNIFVNKEKPNEEIKTKKDMGGELVEQAFGQAIVHQVQTNQDLQAEMLSTAETYTKTKMNTIKTDVDTEHKEAVFNNAKDACESYGFNEKTTPIWATKMMSIGYSIMLAIWLFVGTFTFMPVIFIAKKMVVGLKKTWLAIIFAILLYLGITFVPILLALLNR